MYPRGAQTQCLFMPYLVEIKKEEKKKEKKREKVREGRVRDRWAPRFFVTTGCREESCRKPPGQCSQRDGHDNTSLYFAHRRDMYVSRKRSSFYCRRNHYRFRDNGCMSYRSLSLCRLQVSNKSTIYMHDFNRGLHLHEIHVGVFGENFLSREII